MSGYLFQAGCEPAIPNMPVILFCCVPLDFHTVSGNVLLFLRVVHHYQPCVAIMHHRYLFPHQIFQAIVWPWRPSPFLRSGASVVQGESHELIARLATLSS